MRGYALLLGITLTIGYGYAGQVALTSVQAANRHASLAGRADWPPDALYYGGPPPPLPRGRARAEGGGTPGPGGRAPGEWERTRLESPPPFKSYCRLCLLK